MEKKVLIEKRIPCSVEAEKCLLGSILLDPECYHQIADVVKAADFYNNSNRVIYEAIVSLFSRRITPDIITVSEELDRTEKAEEAGGSFYIVGLVNEVPTSGNVLHYAEIIAKKALLRRMIHAAGEIAGLAYNEEEDAYAKAEKLLLSIQRAAAASSFASMQEVMADYMQELDVLHTNKGQISGIPSGYFDLDSTLGGFQRSDLILLAARPSMGKTSLALCMGYNAALRGKKVAIFSLEMSKRLLARRLMSMQSKVDMQRLRSGWIEDDEWDKIVAAADDLSVLPIYINDVGGNPVASMRSQLRRLQQEQGTIDLVIVDYLGLINPDEDASKRENIVHQISAISKGLKGLAREYDVPVLALCQLSREVERRASKIPLPSDLRDSGSLEQDADVILFIYRDDYYANLENRESERPNIADVIIAKHRNGPTGTVSLYFKPEQTMFYPLETQYGGDGE